MPSRPLVILNANELTRHGLEAMLREHPGWQTTGSFAALEECAAYLRTHVVDVLLWDDSAQMMDTVILSVQQLKAQMHRLKILVLSRSLAAPYIEALLEHGASGYLYLEEDQLRDKLLHAIETIGGGSTYLSPSAAQHTFQQRRRVGRLARVRPRDVQVIKLMAVGKKPSEIARAMGVSVETIYHIRERLRDLLNVQTSEQIVQAAIRAGVIDDPVKAAPVVPESLDMPQD